MSIARTFQTAVAVASARSGMTGPEFLPSQLAWAASRALGGQGAGISWSSTTMRIPLGASSSEASNAERLQFTAGEGPCLDAYAQQESIMASQAVMAWSWPVFAGEFLHRTSFRSIFAAPVQRVGALDVYFTDPAGCSLIDIGDVATVLALISAALTHTPPAVGRVDDEIWMTSPGRRRHQVSIAMGIVQAAHDVEAADALAALRARAFTTDRSVEDVADQVIGGILNPAVLLP